MYDVIMVGSVLVGALVLVYLVGILCTLSFGRWILVSLVGASLLGWAIVNHPWYQEAAGSKRLEHQAKSQLCKVSGGVYTYRKHTGYVCDKTLIDIGEEKRDGQDIE